MGKRPALLVRVWSLVHHGQGSCELSLPWEVSEGTWASPFLFLKLKIPVEFKIPRVSLSDG